MLTRTTVRRLHTSRVSYGFMDWFKMKKAEERKPKPKAEDINTVMAKAEEGEVTVTKMDKIEFIGKKSKKPQDTRPLAERLNGFHIKHWIAKEKVTDEAQFAKLIIDEYNKLVPNNVASVKDVNLANLNLQFQVTKQVQAKSGYLIPDLVLTRASNGQVLLDHFDKLMNGTQSKYHLTLDDIPVTSENVYIQPSVTSRERKTKFKKLLKEAKKAQDEKTEQLIQGVRA